MQHEGYRRVVRALRKAIEMGWQDISTAPKDKRVLLYFPQPTDTARRIEGGSWDFDRFAKRPKPYWRGDGQQLWGVRWYRDNAPTHWMPLPEPPEGK